MQLVSVMNQTHNETDTARSAGPRARVGSRGAPASIPRPPPTRRHRGIDGGWLPGPRGGRGRVLGHPQQHSRLARVCARPAAHERRDHTPEARTHRPRRPRDAARRRKLGQVRAVLCCAACMHSVWPYGMKTCGCVGVWRAPLQGRGCCRQTIDAGARVAMRAEAC